MVEKNKIINSTDLGEDAPFYVDAEIQSSNLEYCNNEKKYYIKKKEEKKKGTKKKKRKSSGGGDKNDARDKSAEVVDDSARDNEQNSCGNAS